MTFHLNFIFNFTLYFSSKQNKGNLKSKSTYSVHCSTDQNSLDRNFYFFPGSILNVKHGCHRAGNSQRKKISSRSGESQRISLQVRGRFMVMNHHISDEIEQQADGGFSRKSILFKHYCLGAINSCTLHVSC